MPTFSQIIAHRGFIPVSILLALSVFVSLIARYSDAMQDDMHKNGVEVMATITGLTQTRSRTTTSGHKAFTALKDFYAIDYQFPLADGSIFSTQRQVSKSQWLATKSGSQFPLIYNRKNPAIHMIGDTDFSPLTARLRIFAWALFIMALLIGLYFYRAEQRR